MLVFDPSNEGYRALTPEEQDTIVAMLDSAEQVKFDDMREALGFPKKNAKSDNWKFNFELDLTAPTKSLSAIRPERGFVRRWKIPESGDCPSKKLTESPSKFSFTTTIRSC